MQKAIKVLEKRISELNDKYKDVSNVVDEPELISDYIFAVNDMQNITIEIAELTAAIKVLNDIMVFNQ